MMSEVPYLFYFTKKIQNQNKTKCLTCERRFFFCAIVLYVRYYLLCVLNWPMKSLSRKV